MAAAAPIIIPALSKASRSAQASITEALTADLVVLRGTSRLSRRKHSTPLEWELHVNPASLGVAAVGAGLTLWLLQLRASPHIVAERVKVDIGHWAWPVTMEWCSGDTRIDQRGEAPTRTYEYQVQLTEGHWEYGAELGWQCPQDGAFYPASGPLLPLSTWLGIHTPHGAYKTYVQTWVAATWETKTATETAVWVKTGFTSDETGNMITRIAVKERQGFLNGGLGTAITEVPWILGNIINPLGL